MSRIWRWITPVAVAGGLVAGAPAIPAATASTAATSIITINATSPNYPGLTAKDHGKVDGHALVVYKATKGSVNTAKISGTVMTTATNDTAKLVAKEFGAKSFTTAGTPVTLTPNAAGVASYSFNVKPSLATQYKVQVAGTDTAVSSVVTVYVSANGHTAGAKRRCSSTKCTFSFRLYTELPASAYHRESGKHWYQYQAVGYPRLPKDYTLSKTAKASKAKKVKSGEFVQTLTYFIPLRQGSAAWVVNACVKDTESGDGLGLPGHHSCGAKHVRRTVRYLG
ncbi:MAG TPA: hypothetical protein VMA72_01335 [Streptosporangiaceae bacterium]|nr:hypothetical protein [Streptosporangiaceae bacterium]